MHWRMDFMPSRLPKAQRAVTRHPSRHASPSVSTDIEQSENKSRSESTPARGCQRVVRAPASQLRDLLTRRVPPPPYLAHGPDGYLFECIQGERTAIRQAGTPASFAQSTNENGYGSKHTGQRTRLLRLSASVTLPSDHARRSLH